MSNIVIVAIPAQDDRIWKISSEKVPHLTLLFLGENTQDVPKLGRIVDFVEHAATVEQHGPAMLSIEERGTLGPDSADVLFFEKDYSIKWLTHFRNQLLQQNDIRAAYDSVTQYPEWQPHLTLGYPATPAHEDKIPDHGLNWVTFDRIAVWTGDYEGPEFKLRWPEGDMEVAYSDAGKDAVADVLEHYGIKGMHWGIRTRQGTRSTPNPVTPKASSHVPSGTKRKTKLVVEGGQNHAAHPDAIKVAEARAKLKKSGAHALSNQELRDVANRVQLENQVAVLTSHKGKQFVTRQLQNEGQSLARAGVRKGVKSGVKKVGVAAFA